jgi:crotonobetainyl-CoA:carnitine CoA-transferase CaiB-like acyl-CoA transferase
MLLQDLKVVELATWIAAPGCAMIMADWGADVIKVESAAGDAIRQFYPDTDESPANPVHSMENRGKRGIVLDIAKPAGREALVRLLSDADVFVTNLRPGPLRRARLDPETLAAAFPRLIYASVTGYGLQGPGADEPAFDMTAFWNRSGVSGAFNPPDREPLACRPAFGDHVTALATLSGVLAALHERSTTGKGRLVEASLVRAGAYALSWDLSVYLRYGEAVTAVPRDERPAPLGGYFQTGDGRWLFVQIRGPNCFPALMKAIGRPELADEPRFAPPVTDMDAVRELRAVMDAVYARMTLAEAGAMLAAADIAWAPKATLGEVVADPQLQAAGLFTRALDGRGGGFPAPATPIRFPGRPETPPRAAPALGEHTRQVLAEAGYGPEAIAAMLKAGAAVQGGE